MEIKTINLNVTLPADGIGMVFMQPFIELNTGREPFIWQDDKKEHQIDRIKRTLQISKSAPHGKTKTHFTIFPEYSIPGLSGIQAVQTMIENAEWQNGTFILAGIDGLTKANFLEMCRQYGFDNVADLIPNHQWVNCYVGWAKEDDGNIKTWVQPKLVWCP